MSSKKTDLENRLQVAIATKPENSDLSICFLAKRFEVPNTPLQNRLKGQTTPRKNVHESQQLLTHLEEKGILQRIQDYNDKGIPLCRRHVMQIVFEILNGKGGVAQIRKGRVDRLVQRHPGI